MMEQNFYDELQKGVVATLLLIIIGKRTSHLATQWPSRDDRKNQELCKDQNRVNYVNLYRDIDGESPKNTNGYLICFYAKTLGFS